MPCSPSSRRTWTPRSKGRVRSSSPSTSSTSRRSTSSSGTGRHGDPAGTALRKRSSASLTRSSGGTRTSANWSSRSPSPNVFRKTRASQKEARADPRRRQRRDPQTARVARTAADLRAVPHAAGRAPGVPERPGGGASTGTGEGPRARRPDDGRPRRKQAQSRRGFAARGLRLAAAPRHRRCRPGDPHRDRRGTRLPIRPDFGYFDEQPKTPTKTPQMRRGRDPGRRRRGRVRPRTWQRRRDRDRCHRPMEAPRHGHHVGHSSADQNQHRELDGERSRTAGDLAPRP